MVSWLVDGLGFGEVCGVERGLGWQVSTLVLQPLLLLLALVVGSSVRSVAGDAGVAGQGPST